MMCNSSRTPQTETVASTRNMHTGKKRIGSMLRLEHARFTIGHSACGGRANIGSKFSLDRGQFRPTEFGWTRARQKFSKWMRKHAALPQRATCKSSPLTAQQQKRIQDS